MSRAPRKPVRGAARGADPMRRGAGAPGDSGHARTDTRGPVARPGASAVRSRARAAPERDASGLPPPEVNLLNLSDSEFALVQAVRALAEGRLEVLVQGRRIVEIVRSQRLPVAAPAESWT